MLCCMAASIHTGPLKGPPFRTALATFLCSWIALDHALQNQLTTLTCHSIEWIACAGMLLALISVVYSALRAGSNTALFRFASAKADAADQPLLDEESGRSYVKVQRCVSLVLPMITPSLCDGLSYSLACMDSLILWLQGYAMSASVHVGVTREQLPIAKVQACKQLAATAAILCICCSNLTCAMSGCLGQVAAICSAHEGESFELCRTRALQRDWTGRPRRA